MDINYWDDYYLNHGKKKDIIACSTFAKFCLDKFFTKKKLNILELGSGNGRDAIYFAHHKFNVIAIDQSIKAIEIEKESIQEINVDEFEDRLAGAGYDLGKVRTHGYVLLAYVAAHSEEIGC